jgi:hypothetical protein
LGRQDLNYRGAQVMIAQMISAGEFNWVLPMTRRFCASEAAARRSMSRRCLSSRKTFIRSPLPRTRPHPNAGKLFIDYALSKEGQTFIKNLGRVISRSDIPQDDLARTKMISEDVTIADRLNQVMDDYKKYMR